MRCAGFTLDRVSFCTRDEQAGSLPIEISTSPPTFRHQLVGACGCGSQHGWAGVAVATRRSAEEPYPDIDDRDRAYRALLDRLTLRPSGHADLRRRGLSDRAIRDAMYRSLPVRGREHTALIASLQAAIWDLMARVPGFFDKNHRPSILTAGSGDGYFVPYADEQGRITGLQVKRLGGRYLTLPGTKLEHVYHVAGRPVPGQRIWLTEGGLKAQVAHALLGHTFVGIAGQALQARHVDLLARFEPSAVVIALDAEDNATTDRARHRWAQLLADAGLRVEVAIWDRAHKGIDDLALAGGRPRLREVALMPSSIGRPRTVRPSRTKGAVDAGGTLAEARAAIATGIRRFMRDAGEGDAMLVTTPPGTGKTTAMAAAIKESRAQARILVGTQALAREQADEHGYLLIEGRSDANCERMDVVNALVDDGHEVEALACGSAKRPRCPFRSACGYYRQFDQVGTRIAATEQIYNPKYLRGGTVVVVDDGDLSRAMVQRTVISREHLARAVAGLARSRRKAARDLLALVDHALIDVRADGKHWLQGPDVWDHLDAQARLRGQDLVSLVRALPRNGTLPVPGEDEGVLSADEVKAGVPAKVARVLAALQDEVLAFERGEPFNSRIRLSAHAIEVVEVRAPATDRFGVPILPTKPLLVLEATPIRALVDRLTRDHTRWPDLTANVRLPENVTVVQYAGSTNGISHLRDDGRLSAMVGEVLAERQRCPTLREAVVTLKAHERTFTDLGFARVLHFGAIRGTNILKDVERLHVAGRPMAPTDDVVFLAQAIHHDEAPVSAQLVFEAQPYGGQALEVDVLTLADPRAAALLRASRDDELVQVIHRARLLMISQQSSLDGDARTHVRLVLHTSQPIAGLRVDELHIASRRDVNEERSRDAEQRIIAAIEELTKEGTMPTVRDVMKAAKADGRTVVKQLGNALDTHRSLLYRGIQQLPKLETASSASDSVAAPVGRRWCDGGCGTPIPAQHARCSACAAESAMAWGRRQRR